MESKHTDPGEQTKSVMSGGSDGGRAETGLQTKGWEGLGPPFLWPQHSQVCVLLAEHR